MTRKIKQHPPEDRCAHCDRRKKHKSGRYCQPCRALLIADKKIPRTTRSTFNTRYKQYMARVEQNMTQEEIAEDLGLSRSYVEGIAYLARKRGWPVPDRTPTTRRTLEHGQGSTGVRGCSCDPCVKTRQEYKALWKKNQAERKARGESYVPPRTDHGEGSNGVRGCKCDLCIQCRKVYRRQWTEDVKVNGKRRGRKMPL